MLTMDETVAAIRALDTDSDILRRACITLSLPPTAKITEEAVVAHEILMRYRSFIENEPHVLTAALAIALGTFGALVCRPGRETSMLQHIVDGVTDQFLASRTKHLEKLHEENPREAEKYILAVVKGIMESGILDKK